MVAAVAWAAWVAAWISDRARSEHRYAFAPPYVSPLPLAGEGRVRQTGSPFHKNPAPARGFFCLRNAPLIAQSRDLFCLVCRSLAHPCVRERGETIHEPIGFDDPELTELAGRRDALQRLQQHARCARAASLSATRIHVKPQPSPARRRGFGLVKPEVVAKIGQNFRRIRRARIDFDRCRVTPFGLAWM